MRLDLFREIVIGRALNPLGEAKTPLEKPVRLRAHIERLNPNELLADGRCERAVNPRGDKRI